MKFRLVAIDLDGTLLNSAKQITQATAAILRDARKTTGVQIVLATARPPRSVLPFYTLLDLDTPMINYNGALVYDPPSQRIMLHRPVPLKIARQIVAMARTVYPEVLVSAEVLDRWYTDRLDANYVTETGRLFEPDVIGPVDTWLNVPVTKLLFLGHSDRLSHVARVISEAHPHQVAMVQTEGNLLQVMHATVSKAQALRAVAAELCVTREQVMAIGDNANDVGMLQWAGVGVAMGNGCPAAIAAADHVTDSHDADGAAKAIRKILLSGKTK